MKIVEFANSVDSAEVAHHEPPHLELHCFLSATFNSLTTKKLKTKFSSANFQVQAISYWEFKD